MAIIEETVYEIPPTGPGPAVIDKIDESITRTTAYGVKSGVRFHLLTNHIGESGKRLSVCITANRCLGTPQRPSTLRLLVRQITGAEPSRPFDPQSLVGMPVHITIAHVEKDGRTYANVVHITPAIAASKAVVAVPQKSNQNVVAEDAVSFPYSA